MGAELTPIEPRPEDVEYLEDRLYEHNVSVTGIEDGQLLAFLVPVTLTLCS